MMRVDFTRVNLAKIEVVHKLGPILAYVTGQVRSDIKLGQGI